MDLLPEPWASWLMGRWELIVSDDCACAVLYIRDSACAALMNGDIELLIRLFQTFRQQYPTLQSFRVFSESFFASSADFSLLRIEPSLKMTGSSQSF